MGSERNVPAVPQTGTSATLSEPQGLAEQFRTKASDRLGDQKSRATQGLQTLVQAVRDTGRQLREKDQSAIAGYVDSAANQIERFSARLENKDIGEIVEDVQNYARRRPAVFIGIGFGIGLLGARFLKSSKPARAAGRRYSGMSGTSGARSPYATDVDSYATAQRTTPVPSPTWER